MVRVVHYRILSAVLLGMYICAYNSPARADDTCPALNRSSAAAMLGSDVGQLDLSVEWHAASDYVCTYTAATGTLTITIGPYHARDGWPAYTARCLAAAEAVPGIGNEAVACYKPSTAAPAEGEIIAHVTDTLLDVHLTQPRPSAQLADTLRRAAQAVAGNLF
jgi:hypothetical protein